MNNNLPQTPASVIVLHIFSYSLAVCLLLYARDYTTMESENAFC